MAITASQVGTANTLEQFRVEYNNLQTDVSGLESGTLSYTALSATTISVSELTVTSSLTAETFIFEGTTNDDFETNEENFLMYTEMTATISKLKKSINENDNIGYILCTISVEVTRIGTCSRFFLTNHFAYSLKVTGLDLQAS